jgi:uncharacterized protein (DUF697 family)
VSDEDYDGIIRKAVTGAAATGPLAMSLIPSADTVVITGIWTTMMIAIARRTGHSLDARTGKKVVLGFIHQAGAYWAGSKALTWIVAKVPGIGMVTGSGANSVLNGTFTVWLGLTFIDLSEREDFELIDWAVYVDSLKDAKRPYADVAKLRRVRDFFKRWLRIKGTTKPVGPSEISSSES